MALESVANILDGDTHVRLDKVVLSTCEGVIETPELGALAVFLLATVVSNSEGTLNPAYGNNTNAKKLLRAEEELLENLNDAWAKRKFEEIRNLSAIYNFSTSPLNNPRTQKSFVPMGVMIYSRYRLRRLVLF